MSDYNEASDAVEAGDVRRLVEAIRAGADLDEEDCGLSLLQHAIDVESQGLLNLNHLDADLTKVLLAYGADPLRPAGDVGISAKQMAHETGHWLASELFEEWAGRNPAAVGEFLIPEPILAAMADGRWRLPNDTAHLTAAFSEPPTPQARLYSLDYLRGETTMWWSALPEEHEQYGVRGKPVGRYRPVQPGKIVLIGDLGKDLPIALDYAVTPDNPSVLYLPSQAPGWIEVVPDAAQFMELICDAEKEAILNRPVRIRVLADYDSYPLWVPGDNIAPETLPITPALAVALDRWADEYTALLNRDDPASTPAPSAEFVARGRDLAHDLRSQLDTGWTVAYFNAHTGEHEEIPPASPPDDYDYCRVFVDGAGTAHDVQRLLLATGHYRLDVVTLIADDIAIDVRRNENGATAATEPAWLGWPVTMEVWRQGELETPVHVMRAVVRRLTADLRAAGAKALVAADFVDDL
jgi:hypothetical protein